MKKRIDPNLIENIMGIGIYNQNYKSAGQKIIETHLKYIWRVSIFSPILYLKPIHHIQKTE